MDNFNKFFNKLLEKSKLSLKEDLNINDIRFIISKINEYFFTNYRGIGETEELGELFEYFSEFHIFWKKYHKQVIDPTIDKEQCKVVAEILHDLYQKFGARLFTDLYETGSLKPDEICNIRYFSANQDFRGSRDFTDLIKIYEDDPAIFDRDNIFNNPEDFLKNIGVTGLSQNDKRVKYAKTAANVLIEHDLQPFELAEFCNNDLLEIKNLLLGNRGSGFGKKKVDMFLRDMVVLNVWKEIKNFDKIDVASDINTIKVALRAGILKTKIPLLSSFLDIFCYQYGLIDKINAQSWRKVWEIWHSKYSNECIESPCLIDYFVYKIIGKDFCKESLCVFKCNSKNYK